MLTYYYTRLAQAICEERLQESRESITLGRPRKARYLKAVAEGKARTTLGLPNVFRSAARAVIVLLM